MPALATVKKDGLWQAGINRRNDIYFSDLVACSR
jgi:hypothetical protein